MYDYIVVELKEIPRPQFRDTATIRGRLIDQKGQLIPGAYFQIHSDGVPQFVAVEPHGNAPSDGTVSFNVTRGRFAVRVLGGRSEDAGWMVTGVTGVGPMSDWEFTFQATGPIPPGLLVSPTNTSTPTSLPTVAPAVAGPKVVPPRSEGPAPRATSSGGPGSFAITPAPTRTTPTPTG